MRLRGCRSVGFRAAGVWVWRRFLVVCRFSAQYSTTKHHEASCGPCARMSSFSYKRGAACQPAEAGSNSGTFQRCSGPGGRAKTAAKWCHSMPLERELHTWRLRGKSDSRTAAFLANSSQGVWRFSRPAWEIHTVSE